MKTEKKRSFKGAVLITVVSVMSLLIIFLTSTLVLATAANNRAHKSYSSSQASYTARAAIDSILKAAKDNENFAIAMNSLKSDGESFNVSVNMESSVAGIGKVENAEIAYAGKKQFYDASKQEWVERDLISVTADVTSGGETKTVTAYVLKDPPTPGGGGGGGGFVTVGNAVISNHTNSFGGTYLGIGMNKCTRYYQGDYSLPGGQIVSLEDKLYLNRKDGAVADTNESGAYVPNVPENSDMLVKFNTGNDQTIEAPFVVNGSLDVNTKTHVYFPTKGSGMAVWGNMNVQNSDFKVYSETVNNDTAVKFNQEISKFQDIPYIYVDSLLKLNNQTIGNDKLPLNIFCGSFDATLNGTTTYANIYCQDSNKNSYLGAGNTALHAWSNSVLNGTKSYLGTCTAGNFYTKGNLEIKKKGASIDGDLVVEGDLVINLEQPEMSLNVGGSVVVKGTLKVLKGTINAGNGIYATYATGTDVATTATKKMTADGSQELYERQENITYCVFATGVGFPTSWGGVEVKQAWLKPEAITQLGLPDDDGDGIVDGNYWDFHGALVDSSLIVESDYWFGDPNSVTREYSHEVKWVNRDDPTDITYNEIDTYEAGGTYTYKGSGIGSPDLYASTHNNQLFPKEAEKAVILGLEEIGNGTPITDSKVLKTIEEIETEYDFSTKSITEIPAEGNYRIDVNTNVYTNADVPDEILNQSCTLKGNGFNKTIYIKNTTSNDIWVKLQDFSMDAKDFEDYGIIYDDSTSNCGNLILFIEGNVTFDKGSIMTKSYYDLIKNNKTFQIANSADLYAKDNSGNLIGEKAECPKIKIYSEKARAYDANGNVSTPSLTFWNFDKPNKVVTANIEAPNMAFYIQKAGTIGSEVYYDGIKVKDKDGNAKCIGVIGVLNVAYANGENEWTFLYTPRDMPDGDPDGDPDSVSKEFDVMYYDGF